jgi:general secretion pathway protein B
MSYILLAIKRSQVDRDAEQAVVRGTVRSSSASARRLVWPWLVGGGLAVNALAVGAVFVATRQPGPDVVASLPAAVETAERPTVAEASKTETPAEPAPTTQASTDTAPTMPAEIKPSPTNGAASRAQQGNRRSRLGETKDGEVPALKVPAVAAPRPDASVALVQPPTPVRPAPPVQARPTAPEPAIVPRQPTTAPEVPVESSARRRRRAARGEPTAGSGPQPATTQPTRATGSELALKIEVLVWAADPKQRMVYMNGLKYVEGQKLESGAVIEQIVEDGVVLVQNGQRIRVRSDPR